MRKVIYILAVLFVAGACSQDLVLYSPDSEKQVELYLDEHGVPCYRISVSEKPFILDSSMGLEAAEINLSDGFNVVGIRRSDKDEEWAQPWGENKQMRDRHNEMAVLLKNDDDVRLTIRFRAFDDGMGYRYEYDDRRSGLDSLTIVDDNTCFRFAQDGTCWSIGSYFSGYELPYREQMISETENANTPFTFKMGDVYGSIHEAALYDFPEMNIYNQGELSFKSELAPRPDGTLARVGAEFTTPWRTIQIAQDAVGLINSSLILNLNEPCVLEDVSWIRPQKYVGVWWGMHLGTQVWTMGPRHGATTENAMRHIDFAAENNIGGVLFEGWNKGWENWGGNQHFDYSEPYEDFDLERIAAYAAEKGVSLWMHNETGGSIFEYEAAMDEAFAKYQSLGVRHLKTGYAGGMPDGIRHHSQRGVQHYQKVVETAARYQIAIDAHEPIKETGIRRTWPNMMTREGARGMEWNAWSEGNSSEHLCTLPYTRLLSGPMDYTPGVFDIYYKTACATTGREAWNGDNSRTYVKTTLARQIANWVILYSPLQMACDLIENYEGHPAFQFFRDFDPDCDWSKALAGEIGDYIVVARRAGDRYFLGAGTDGEPRTLDIPLDFLAEGVKYEATIYADDLDAPIVVQPDGSKAPDKTCYRIEKMTVTNADILQIAMAADGGQAVIFDVYTDDGWVIRAEGECPDYTGAAAANGTMGLLHWKEPFSIRQIVLNNVFELNDRSGVNCAVLGLNPFALGLTVDGKSCGDYSHWSQTIDMKNAEHTTSFRIADKVDVNYSLVALRNLPHTALLKVKVKALDDAVVAFEKSVSVPDGYQRPRNFHRDFFADGRRIRLQQCNALTAHGRHDVSAASMFVCADKEGIYDTEGDKSVLTFDMIPGETVEFAVVGSICSTAEYSDPYSEAQRELVYVERLGVDRILEGHRKLWSRLWESDIIVEGDMQARRIIRFALYNLYSSCREGTRNSIPPMGLSSQGYNGHVFWDTELWMYPPMLLLNQGIAGSMIDYRIDRIGPAGRKASDYGYQGLMFPWESDSDGQESTPVWALTGPMEHHVTSDIGIAAWNYYLVTKDERWLREEAWEMIKGIADFWVSRVDENPDGTYSINGVVGADEYAQNVNDNAFTNASASVALQNAVKAAGICGYDAPEIWGKVARGLRYHRNAEGVTMEYDGYSGEQIKQADVNLLAYPLGVVDDRNQMLKDLAYYEDRIDLENGPAMTFSIFAIQYARLGDKTKATEMLHRAYEPYIRPPFGVFAETPTSNNPYFMTGAGGLLQAVLFGFGGLHITEHGIVQKNPILPTGWTGLSITGVGPQKKTFFASLSNLSVY